MRFYKHLIVAIALLFPSYVYAQTLNTGIEQPYLNITAPNQIDGLIVNPNTPLVFSTALPQNPLMQDHWQDITLVQANAGAVILASTPGRTIYPSAFTIMASGTPTTATTVYLECTDGSTLLASFQAAALVTNVPISPFSSSSTGKIVAPGTALARGCGAGQGVFLSTAGTLATTTDIFVNLPYTVQ